MWKNLFDARTLGGGLLLLAAGLTSFALLGVENAHSPIPEFKSEQIARPIRDHKGSPGLAEAKVSDSQFGIDKIAITRDSAVHLCDLKPRKCVRVSDGYDPDISPKDDSIVFTSPRNGSETDTTIKLLKLQTTTPVTFKSLEGKNVSKPRWSKDGSKIAFNVVIDDRNHIGILDLVTGLWRNITADIPIIDTKALTVDSWLPDVEAVLCHDLSNLYEISITGDLLTKTPVESIIRRGEVSTATRFRFSQNRQFLLFDGTRRATNTTIYLFDFAKNDLRQLIPASIDGIEPIWLPSEKMIMFSCGTRRSTEVIYDLCVMTLQNGEVTTLIEDASGASYSAR